MFIDRILTEQHGVGDQWIDKAQFVEDVEAIAGIDNNPNNPSSLIDYDA